MIVGCSNAVFMLIARMPYVALISVVVGVTNLAPTFGPIVGALIGAFILFLVKPIAVIPFLLFTVVIQTVDGYVIKPKFYGSALSVPSVWVLVAIIVLGRMFGVAGILLAIPIAAIITYMIRDLLAKQDENESKE
jgi:predicted PurR-regulated permease PerM